MAYRSRYEREARIERCRSRIIDILEEHEELQTLLSEMAFQQRALFLGFEEMPNDDPSFTYSVEWSFAVQPTMGIRGRREKEKEA